MIRMCEDVSGPATISQRLAWSHSSAQCRCAWTKDGTKFSSICPISRDGRTAPIMWKLCGFKFMPIAEYDASTFQIDCTRKMSCHPNSNYFCPFRSRRPKQSQLSPESTPNRDVLPIPVSYAFSLIVSLTSGKSAHSTLRLGNKLMNKFSR